MLSQMREGRFIRAVLWIVVVAFVATMVFVWGADYQGLGCGNQPPQGQRWIGMVGDLGLSVREYDQRYRQGINQLAQGRQPDQVITQDERLRVMDQVFDQMVNQALFSLEAERLGLLPGDNEIAQVLQFDPPEFLKQQFRDQEGNFDRAAYELALNNPNIDWRPFEEAVRASLPGERLRQIVGSSVHVGEGEIRQEFERRFSKAKVLYTGLAWRDAELAQEDPGDDALRTHFTANQERFEEPERYRIEAVQLSRDASPSDEAYILQRLEDLRTQITGGRSFEDIAKLHSEDPSNSDTGGDLGWFGHGRMVPDFETVAFALADGEVSEPVRTRFGYHLIRKEASRELDGEEEVHARHILLRVEPSYTTVDSMAALADTLYNMATELGELGLAAERLGMELLAPGPFTERESIEGLGYNSAVKVTVSRLDVGQVSRPFSARDANYIVQLKERSDPATGAFEDMRDEVLRDWQETEKKRVAHEKAAEILALREREVINLRDAASRLGFEAVETEEFTRRDYIPGVGAEGSFQVVSFLLNQGDVSGVIDTPQGSFVLEVLKKIESDKTIYGSEREGILQSLIAQVQQDYFESWMEKLKDKYEVEDWRDQFYN